VIHATALAVHSVEAEVLGLALGVVFVDERAIVIGLAARVAGEVRAAALVELLVDAVTQRKRRDGGDDESAEAEHYGGLLKRGRKSRKGG